MNHNIAAARSTEIQNNILTPLKMTLPLV